MPRNKHRTTLPAPFLKSISVKRDVLEKKKGYPFDLVWLRNGEFVLEFAVPVTIVVGENGTGKSTLIEAIAALCGYDEAGGGKGYKPVDHAGAVDRSGADLADALRGAWLPRVTDGWFFKAESFFSVARYLDASAVDVGAVPPDFLSWSHGEGFVRFFEERMSRQGIYFMDEPESALSPKRQLELLRILKKINESAVSQVVMATHSPILMALPGACVLEVTPQGIDQVDYRDTSHFRLYQDFTIDPEQFIADALKDEQDSLF